MGEHSFQFLEQATVQRQKRVSNRVLKCQETGESGSIDQLADALSDSLGVNKKVVSLKLNYAARFNKPAYGLRWALLSGTPYPALKKR